MPMTPEGKVKERVKKLLKDNDVYFFMPASRTFTTSTGIPDFICCVRGCFVGIETKAGHNKPTAMQREQMRQIVEHGGYTFVVTDHPASFDMLKEWIETANHAFRRADGKHFEI